MRVVAESRNNDWHRRVLLEFPSRVRMMRFGGAMVRVNLPYVNLVIKLINDGNDRWSVWNSANVYFRDVPGRHLTQPAYFWAGDPYGHTCLPHSLDGQKWPAAMDAARAAAAAWFSTDHGNFAALFRPDGSWHEAVRRDDADKEWLALCTYRLVPLFEE